MSTPKDGGPAFPAVKMRENGSPECTEGMTLRDWFAGQALNGLIACPDIQISSLSGYAQQAYRQADAMIVERKKSP